MDGVSGGPEGRPVRGKLTEMRPLRPPALPFYRNFTSHICAKGARSQRSQTRPSDPCFCLPSRTLRADATSGKEVAFHCDLGRTFSANHFVRGRRGRIPVASNRADEVAEVAICDRGRSRLRPLNAEVARVPGPPIRSPPPVRRLGLAHRTRADLPLRQHGLSQSLELGPPPPPL